MPTNPILSARKRRKLERQSSLYKMYHCPACLKENAHRADYKFFQCGYCGYTADTENMQAIHYPKLPLAAILPQSRLDVLDMLEGYQAKRWTPPTIREIAFALDISHDTARRSLIELSLLGLIGAMTVNNRRRARTITVRIKRQEWDNREKLFDPA